jgi:hypothetical protein
MAHPRVWPLSPPDWPGEIVEPMDSVRNDGADCLVSRKPGGNCGGGDEGSKKISIILFFIGTFGEESADHERNFHAVGCSQRRCAARVVGYFSLDRCVQLAAIVEAAQQ